MRASIIQFPMCAMAIFLLLGIASLAIFIHSFTCHRLDLLCESLRRIVSYYCAGSKEKGKKEEEEKENPLDLPILSAAGGVHESPCSFKKKKKKSFYSTPSGGRFESITLAFLRTSYSIYYGSLDGVLRLSSLLVSSSLAS